MEKFKILADIWLREVKREQIEVIDVNLLLSITKCRGMSWRIAIQKFRQI